MNKSACVTKSKTGRFVASLDGKVLAEADSLKDLAKLIPQKLDERKLHGDQERMMVALDIATRSFKA